MIADISLADASVVGIGEPRIDEIACRIGYGVARTTLKGDAKLVEVALGDAWTVGEEQLVPEQGLKTVEVKSVLS